MKNQLKTMISSVFTYGSLDPNSHQFKTYILPYEAKLGKATFDKVLKEETKRLTEGFTVIRGVYEDSEGCSYNSLVPILQSLAKHIEKGDTELLEAAGVPEFNEEN